jgi:hypothetical protein
MYSEPSHEYEYPVDDYQYPTEAELDDQNIDIYVNNNGNIDYYEHMNRMYAAVFDQLVQEGVIVPNSQIIDQIEPSQPNIIQTIDPAQYDPQQDLDDQHDHYGDDIDRHIDEAMMDYFNRHEPR